MGNSVFPVLPGLAWNVIKTPNWGTRMQRAVSGRTLRISDYVNPIWNFTLTYEFLHDSSFGAFTSPTTALRSLMDFFNSRAGAFDTFLFPDPSDFTVTQQPIATGNGSQVTWQLVRQLVPNGFSETIVAPNVVSAVYLNGVPQSSTLYSVDNTTGLVTFLAAPGSGVVISATFTYYFRVYFEDALNFDNFMFRLWQLKQVKLTSVVL